MQQFDPNQAPQPPYVSFELQPVEDRNASIAEGRFVTVDKAFAIITPAGSKDRVVRLYDEWIVSQKEATKAGRIPPNWVPAWEAAYAAWQASEEIPVQGMPVKNWRIPSPSQIKNLTQLHFLTVEQVAEMTEEGIQRVGMGARELKMAAQAWLKSENQAKATQAITALEAQNSNLRTRVDSLEEQIRALLPLVPEAVRPKVEVANKPATHTV